MSKLRCFLSRAAAAALARSTSMTRSSISVWSRCLVFSREEHLALEASTDSSASCRRVASFFLIISKKHLTLMHQTVAGCHYAVYATNACHPLCFLQLLSPLDGVGLILGSPLSHFSIGLGQSSLELRLGLLLLLILLSQEVTVVARRLQRVGQGALGL